MAKQNKETVYVSRDESDMDRVWVWRKPIRGNFKPQNVGEFACNYQRPESIDEWDSWNAYEKEDFKKIFGILPKKNEILKIDAYKKNLFNEKAVFRVK